MGCKRCQQTSIIKKSTISSDDLEPKFAKERIRIWIDEDVLDKFKKIARNGNKKYQSLINEVLRNYAFSQKSKDMESVIKKLEAVMRGARKP